MATSKRYATFKSVSRNTIKNEILQIYDVEKMKTLSILEANTCIIALTTDLWTASSQRKGHMVVTAHFIGESWCLRSRISRFIYAPCPHTAETVCEALHDCVMAWNIDRRLSTLTVDNCSTNDKVIEFMLEKLNKNDLWLNGQLYQVRCCAHILNLIVKDGLAVIGDGIEIICDSVAYWVATPQRIERFVEVARQLNIECKQMSKKQAERMSIFDAYVNETNPTSRLELDAYLEEKILPNTLDFDILTWWKTNGNKYPILARVDRDVLVIPVSTIASESAFSTSGRVVSLYRSNLHPDTLEALMCPQNWLWADKRGSLTNTPNKACFEEDSDGDGKGEEIHV
ncbi:hypothetical protein Dsin_018834 [Dipteronia sinensis]|uniref:HAT C-terminal dimerisation domain-containing protein n=1 Tax=Dipteronia sinensis TaxID=43782 RepID=A0AAE0A7J3_9ROSI|nr:hypothetical protein Dsin_018834 [Dipteronia sinensis]